MLSTTINAQQTKSNIMTNQEIVKKFLNGFNNPVQIQKSFALLADNYHFTSPTDENNSKVEFMTAAKEIAKILTGIEIKKLAVNNNWVAVNYIFTSSIKGLENTSGTEWFRVENEKIQESHLNYDASDWRKVFAKMSE